MVPLCTRLTASCLLACLALGASLSKAREPERVQLPGVLLHRNDAASKDSSGFQVLKRIEGRPERPRLHMGPRNPFASSSLELPNTRRTGPPVWDEKTGRHQGHNNPSKGSHMKDTVQSQGAGVQAVLSDFGLEYAKEVLLKEVLKELVPLTFPDMFVPIATPMGTVNVNLTSIVLWNATVPDATLLLDHDENAITVYTQSMTANLSCFWSYSYGVFGDNGKASVNVQDMQFAVLGNLSAVDGALSVGIVDQLCIVNQIQILLHGRYSWIYSWLEAMLPNHLRAAVASEVTSSVAEIVEYLDEFLQALPRQVEMDRVALLDVSVPLSPLVLPHSVILQSRGTFLAASNNGTRSPWLPPRCSRAETDGLRPCKEVAKEAAKVQRFQGKDTAEKERAGRRDATTLHMENRQGNKEKRQGEVSGLWQQGRSCSSEGEQMVTLSVQATVLDSALEVYYQAGAMSLVVQKLPPSFPLQLNTRSWRFFLPKLYQQYPNKDMQFAFAPVTMPSVTLTEDHGVEAAVSSALLMQVILEGDNEQGTKHDDVGAVESVMSISIALNFSAVAGIRENNITFYAELRNITVQLQWSTVGGIPQALIEALTRAVARFILMPLLNLRLALGFPLPSIPGVLLQNATVVHHRGALEVCADLRYTGGIFGLPPAPQRLLSH